MNYSETALPLSIRFGLVRWGLLHFTLSLGDESVETNFSDVYDPIYRLKHWLEAISVGVEQCSFSYDPEGNDIRFDFRQVTYDRSEFSVAYAYSTDDDEVLLSGNVDRRQLVECLYKGFLDLDASLDFDRYSWEPEPYWHQIRHEIGLDVESIIDRVSKLTREELRDLDTRLESIRPVLVKGETFPEDSITTSFSAPFYWDIPENYDDLPTFRKRSVLFESLHGHCGMQQNGTCLRELESPTIESFLSGN